MTYVVVLHGSAGSGKSTLCRVIGEYLGSDCLVLQENFDEILATPSSNDDRASWYRRTTVISADDNATHFLIDHISLLPLFVFTLMVHFLMGTVWPVVILFIICLAIGRLHHWMYNHMLSKLWLYNIFLFSHRERKSDCRWIWRDRTCVDIYAYCLLNKSTAVPLNMSSLLLEQTQTTSVAIILDVPRNIINKHLRTRINEPTTSFFLALVTRLILFAEQPIDGSIAALALVEQWYRKMNVPVIKISQIRDKLDHDTNTGEIQWSKHSIRVLIESIEQAIQQRGPLASTIDESLMPWKIVQNSRLFHI